MTPGTYLPSLRQRYLSIDCVTQDNACTKQFCFDWVSFLLQKFCCDLLRLVIADFSFMSQSLDIPRSNWGEACKNCPKNLWHQLMREVVSACILKAKVFWASLLCSRWWWWLMHGLCTFSVLKSTFSLGAHADNLAIYHDSMREKSLWDLWGLLFEQVKMGKTEILHILYLQVYDIPWPEPD